MSLINGSLVFLMSLLSFYRWFSGCHLVRQKVKRIVK